MRFKGEKIKHIINKAQQHVEVDLKPYDSLVHAINSHHRKFSKYTDDQLKRLIIQIRYQSSVVISNELIVVLFALIKEICVRSLHIVPTDLQIIAGIALNQGKLVEMQTGEGKTLVGVFAGCIDALIYGSTHILTFNDYLAKRDAEWMRPVFNKMGFSVGYIEEDMEFDIKQAAYDCDITYATAKEVGFDYLRSLNTYSLKTSLRQGFNSVIIDEADAILIDEARNPMVLAGNLIETNINFKRVSEFTSILYFNVDFQTDEYCRNVYLTEQGIEKAEKYFNIKNLHSSINLELHSAINLSLQARTLLRNGVDYIVKGNKIKLVDEFTGRIVEDRKWKNGLQTAVETKEGITSQTEGTILNSISVQHLMQLYSKISGMTATAKSAAEEFNYFYNLRTLIIPSHNKSKRIDHPDVIFNTKDAKNKAIIEEVLKVHKTGRPILIGTLTVQESEDLSNSIREYGISCNVLNAKNDEEEAGIISKAGMKYSVTISTNMAGRGTDIVLGGEEKIFKKEIEALGGLYVIGTNRHESLRIDRQLRGRAGRQGDPGSTRFFVSVEDNLMTKYNLKDILPEKSPKNYIPNNEIDHIQRVIEGQMFDLRKFIYCYSYLIEKQRIIISNEREKILKDLSIKKELKKALLIEYDKFWAKHLDYLNELKEGSHLLRIGGLDPLREFQKKADISFQEMTNKLEKRICFLRDFFKRNPDASISMMGINIPSSQWTYIVNDVPFGNNFGIMLSQNSNIGFQVDILSIVIIFIFKLFKRKSTTKNSGS